MGFLFVQKEAGVAKCGVAAECTAEHTCPGVPAVFMAMQGLPVLCGIRAKLALVNRLRICICGVLELHMAAQFSLSLAGVCTHLTDQGFFLVTEFMAVQLVDAMATIWTLITFVPEREERQDSKQKYLFLLTFISISVKVHTLDLLRVCACGHQGSVSIL